jgi:hypothetical protein
MRAASLLSLSTLTATLLLQACGDSSNDHSSPATTLPEYVPIAVRQEWLRVISPPQGFTAVLFWGTAIHDTRQTGASQIEIDWQRLTCRVGTNDVLVDENQFDSQVSGGLCTKSPWCPANLGGLPYSASASTSTATMVTSSQPNYAFHWWGTYGSAGRPSIPAGASRCWVEARVRITGPALVQVGFDWYPQRTGDGGAAGGVVEGAVSNWARSSADWQVMSVGRP